MEAGTSSLDRISALPQPIIDNILCRLSIEDVVRTSILSSNWRYNWIKIPKLEFIECLFKVSTDKNHVSALEKTFEIPSQRKNMTKRCKFFYAIYQVLLLHQGPVDVFSLSMTADETCVELDQIILHLSRNNTLKKFTLCLSKNSSAYVLPSSFFSLSQLTDLSLNGCDLDHQPSSFKGFGSLTTLYLDDVSASKNTLVCLVSSSPLIKRFTLLIEKENIGIDDNTNITELLDCLHGIEHLCISHSAVQCFAARGGVPQELPFAFVHLKCFCFVEICFVEKYLHGLPFVGLVIRSSPNLEKLRLTIYQDPYLDKAKIESINLEDYSDIWLEHLKELEIEDFVNLKHELEFVKLIIAKSPVMKKVSIFLCDEVTKDEEMMVLRILLCSARSSPHVKIFVERRPDK